MQKTVSEKILDDIKRQYQSIIDTNENIKKRASQLMSFIGISMAAATGLVLFEPNGSSPEKIIGFIGVLLISPALIYCLRVIHTRGIAVPLGSRTYLERVPDGHRLNTTYEEHSKLEANHYAEVMSVEYLKSLEDEENLNKKLGGYFNVASTFFIAGIILYVSQAPLRYVGL